MSNKCNTLFVFEGEHTEDKIVARLEKHFMGKSIAVKCVFGGDIYQLYQRIKDEDFDVDIVSLLKERSEVNNKELEGYDNDSFSYIYFFFDYDAHATSADDDKISELISYFDNETETGKLFVSYPMVEAIRHFKDKASFLETTVKCKRRNCPNREECDICTDCLNEPHYKKFVPTDSDVRYSNLNTTEMWVELIDAHLCKANFVVNDNKSRPQSLLSQEEIFEGQKRKYICQHCPHVAVISAFPMFVQDFYGVETLNEKLDNTRD